MSHSRLTTDSPSSFPLIIDNALKAYEKRTKKDLLAPPLADELQTCDSPSSILGVLQQHVQGLDLSRSGDEKWTKWLDPTINVLFSFSAVLGTGIGMVFSPANVIFAGIGVLLSTAMDVRGSQDTLLDIFERMEDFFRRLEIYTRVPPTAEMMDTIIQIMAEILCILGIAMKVIKQGRIKKYMKRLIGRTDLEDALKRLDKLTKKEAQMAIAQNLKATHTVDERVKGVASTVVAIDDKVAVMDDRVAGVDDRVARVDDRVSSIDNRMASVNDKVANVVDKMTSVDSQAKVIDARVAGVDDRVRGVDDKLAEVIHGGKEDKQVIKQTFNDVDQLKQNQLWENIHKWLSPPDPSTNHNIACDTHLKKEASWFLQGSIFREWKSTGSLLWIHGKPGSGKSILCSTIIQNIKVLCKAGEASMAYFYFDFRSANKQTLHDLISSLLTQLSARSGLCCDILSKLYSDHNNGMEQPDGSILTKCLEDMLAIPDQPPIYLIIDALDESPNTFGMLSPRESVLQLLKELVYLRLPNVHICATSRPEIEIRDIIVPLTSLRVSLHDQSGQKEDIADYVRSVVYSNSEPIMRRWKMEDKELVIKVLSERADGMFRWVFCQLEVLRNCFPPSVRRSLEELPESLDETYERILKEIKKPHRDHARRLLQCLVVAFRPLCMEELAEVLAVDFDDASGIPKLQPSWRWEDQEQALLTSCSSLIAIIDTGLSRVVQFSHFSVKEYLISERLATSSEDLSYYDIVLEPAHIILAQASLSVLLRVDDLKEDGGIEERSPLALYAAEYGMCHVTFEDMAPRIKGMEDLFDPDKPYFAAWRRLHDIRDIPIFPRCLRSVVTTNFDEDTPVYYAALAGFADVVEHLIAKHPEHLTPIHDYYRTPLVALLTGEHLRVAEILHRHGLSVCPQGGDEMSTLYSAADRGDLDYRALVKAKDKRSRTPFDFADEIGKIMSGQRDDIIKILSGHHAR